MTEPEIVAAVRAAREGDKAATEAIFAQFHFLAVKYSRKWKIRGWEPEDVYQMLCLAMFKAIKCFNPEYGTKFVTYLVATWTQQFLREKRQSCAGVIRIPAHVRPKHAQSLADASNIVALTDKLEVVTASNAPSPIERAIRREDVAFVRERLAKQRPADRINIEEALAGIRLVDQAEMRGYTRERARQVRGESLRRFAADLIRHRRKDSEGQGSHTNSLSPRGKRKDTRERRETLRHDPTDRKRR